MDCWTHSPTFFFKKKIEFSFYNSYIYISNVVIGGLDSHVISSISNLVFA